MAIYSIGRKRVMLALLLTTVLLLTLDLRGNPIIDGVREGFTRVLQPIESATGVVTNPIERAWNGVVNYDDLRQENYALQEQVDRLIGTQAAAEAAVIEGKELQALYSLPSLAGIDTEVARVVGYSANNLDQVIEINKGRKSGIAVGMAVVNQAGLVGKVTNVTDYTAQVMLVTDARYTVAVKVTSAGDTPPLVAPTTAPSGLTPEELESAEPPAPTTPDGLPATGTTLPGATTDEPILDPITGEPLTQEQLDGLAGLEAQEGEGEAGADTSDDDETGTTESTTTTSSTTTTTTIPEIVEKEYGGLEGRGGRRLPQVRFLQDTPSLTELEVGDLVETAGGSASLAPTGIPVGRVINRADRPGSGGPLLDVDLYADLGRLNFVRVVLYKPLAEVEQ